MNLKPGAHIHLIGICGTAMASLAGLLKSQGFHISGSDQNVYPPMSTQLEELGIQIQQGYKKENLTPRPDLVIVGNVISRGNEEAKALLESDIPYTSLPKAMGDFAIADKNSIVIAGTHGKTTATSMMIKVADQCGVQPGFMVGGIPIDSGRSFRNPKGNYFIIEGDEYDTAFFDKVPKFIHYKPKFVILTSIEFDHADIYKDLNDVKKAFRMLIERIPADGFLVACSDYENVMELARDAKCKVITYGVGAAPKQFVPFAHYQIVDREIFGGRNQFSLLKTGTNVGNIAIKSPGEHNALNATAVFIVSQELGWSISKTLQGLADYKGVKRRQEEIGTPHGVILIEDFAHHPTAVKVTSEAIREKYFGSPSKDNMAKTKGENPEGRLFCLFEPRSATSRRKIFQKEYVKAFQAADKILIAKAYDQSKIAEADRFSTHELVEDLKKSGQDAFEMPSTEDIVSYLKSEAKKGDVVLIMSNGGFDGIYQKLLAAL